METVNVFAKDLRSKVKKDCPLISGAWVEFYDDVIVGTISIAQEAQSNGDIIKTLDLLVLQIASWNFADEKGQLEVSVENLKKLPLSLLEWLSTTLFEVINEGAESKKKALQKPS